MIPLKIATNPEIDVYHRKCANTDALLQRGKLETALKNTTNLVNSFNGWQGCEVGNEASLKEKEVVMERVLIMMLQDVIRVRLNQKEGVQERFNKLI